MQTTTLPALSLPVAISPNCLVCGRKRSACKSLRACVVFTSREVNKLKAQLAALKAVSL